MPTDPTVAAIWRTCHTQPEGRRGIWHIQPKGRRPCPDAHPGDTTHECHSQCPLELCVLDGNAKIFRQEKPPASRIDRVRNTADGTQCHRVDAACFVRVNRSNPRVSVGKHLHW